MIDWFIDRLIDWSIYKSIVWLIDWQYCRSTCTQLHPWWYECGRAMHSLAGGALTAQRPTSLTQPLNTSEINATICTTRTTVRNSPSKQTTANTAIIYIYPSVKLTKYAIIGLILVICHLVPIADAEDADTCPYCKLEPCQMFCFRAVHLQNARQR